MRALRFDGTYARDKSNPKEALPVCVQDERDGVCGLNQRDVCGRLGRRGEWTVVASVQIFLYCYRIWFRADKTMVSLSLSLTLFLSGTATSLEYPEASFGIKPTSRNVEFGIITKLPVSRFHQGCQISVAISREIRTNLSVSLF